MTSPVVDPETFTPAIPGGRPAMPPAAAELQDTWLTPNGIIGWIPEHAEIVVADATITWPAWRHEDGTLDSWGTDLMVASDEWTQEQRSAYCWDRDQGDRAAAHTPLTVSRTLPLLVPVTDRVRELCATTGLRLVEQQGG